MVTFNARQLTLVLVACMCLAAIPGQTGAAPSKTDRFVVQLGTSTSLSTVQAALDDVGGELLRADETLGFAVLRTEDPDRLGQRLGQELDHDPRGGAAGHTPGAHAPSDTYFGAQWGPIELNMGQAWNIETGSTGVRVAIVDSGIEPWHPDFSGTAVTLGYDYVDGDSQPYDGHDHGTHVAGTVAATRDNGVGVAGLANVELYVVRVLDANNAGWCSDFASGIREATDAGADIINLSLYCSAHWQPLHDAIRYADANGALVVAAAGNFQTSNPGACVTFPARYVEALAVASVDPTLTPSYFSCQGPEVEIAAPGQQVLSTVRGGGYAFFSGTSMATPHVAGAAGLLLSDDPSLSANDLRDRLTQTARDLGTPGHDPIYGHGMLDPVAALTGAPVTV